MNILEIAKQCGAKIFGDRIVVADGGSSGEATEFCNAFAKAILLDKAEKSQADPLPEGYFDIAEVIQRHEQDPNKAKALARARDKIKTTQQQAEPLAFSEIEEIVFESMSKAFKLGNLHMDGLPIDDTQLGVEFALERIKKLYPPNTVPVEKYNKLLEALNKIANESHHELWQCGFALQAIAEAERG